MTSHSHSYGEELQRSIFVQLAMLITGLESLIGIILGSTASVKPADISEVVKTCKNVPVNAPFILIEGTIELVDLSLWASKAMAILGVINSFVLPTFLREGVTFTRENVVICFNTYCKRKKKTQRQKRKKCIIISDVGLSRME